MSSKVYFNETQYINSPVLKVLVITASIGALAPLLVACYRQLVLDQPWGQQPTTNLGLLLITLSMLIILVVVNLLIFNSKLETKITAREILYRYRPFVYNWKGISPRDIESAALRTYNAWKEYGGRGFKFRYLGAKGRAITMGGNQGLQLQFKNGKKLLLGTQRPSELQVALRKLMEDHKM